MAHRGVSLRQTGVGSAAALFALGRGVRVRRGFAYRVTTFTYTVAVEIASAAA